MKLEQKGDHWSSSEPVLVTLKQGLLKILRRPLTYQPAYHLHLSFPFPIFSVSK